MHINQADLDMQQAVAPKIRFVSGCEAIFKTPVWLGTGNEMTQETIAAAGNVEVPAYLTLVALGFSVDRVDKDGEDRWVANKGTLQLIADSPLSLLGLSLMRSKRGPSWQSGDKEIEEFLTRFYPSAGQP